MTPQLLSEAMGIPLVRARKWAEPLAKAMAGGQINTRLRTAAFLAQVGHETNGLLWVRELGGSSYFAKYEGRKDLGNTAPGDGPKFFGRGLIQVTGRANYLAASKALFGDDRLLKTPELLEQPEWAAESAVWFWSSRNLNALADVDRFTDLTKRINGGTNGIEDRKLRYRQALKVLS
jgi:putative chitinase